MKLRLMGSPQECGAAVALLHQLPGLRLTEVSRPYPNRNDPQQVRVYVEANLDPAAVTAATEAAARHVAEYQRRLPGAGGGTRP